MGVVDAGFLNGVVRITMFFDGKPQHETFYHPKLSAPGRLEFLATYSNTWLMKYFRVASLYSRGRDHGHGPTTKPTLNPIPIHFQIRSHFTNHVPNLVHVQRLLFAMLRSVPQQYHGIARFSRHALDFAASAGLVVSALRRSLGIISGWM